MTGREYYEMGNRKSGFLAFVFSFMPGAGEMYLGLMKKGIVIMAVFSGCFMLSAFIRNGIFACLMPIVWFYSFFDTMNLRHLTEEQKIQHENRFLTDMDYLLGRDWRGVLSSKRRLVGGLCVFFGAYMLFQNFMLPILDQVWQYVPWAANLIYNLPTIFVAAGIIWLGLRLLKGNEIKKQIVDKDFIDYGGDENDRN